MNVGERDLFLKKNCTVLFVFPHCFPWWCVAAVGCLEFLDFPRGRHVKNTTFNTSRFAGSEPNKAFTFML